MGTEESAPRGCATMLYGRPGRIAGLLQLRSDHGPAQDRTEEDRNGNRSIASFPSSRGRARRRKLPLHPVRLSDLYPLLAQAYRDNYVWLRDFEDDRLMVSNDLYEVIRAFSNCRPSA